MLHEFIVTPQFNRKNGNSSENIYCVIIIEESKSIFQENIPTGWGILTLKVKFNID